MSTCTATVAAAAPTTTSAMIATTVSGSHEHRIDGYKRTSKLVGNGHHVDSSVFHIAGGHSWYIKLYPNGSRTDDAGYVSVFLSLADKVSKPVHVGARFTLLCHDTVDQSTCHSYNFTKTLFTEHDNYGFPKFIKKKVLEKKPHYLKDDCFTIRCDVTVMKEVLVEERHITVPRSNLGRQLHDLLLSKEGADVTFDVGGELFEAHRLVLAARSPVFKAELYGSMKEKGFTTCIRIADMEASVFKAMLHFIYTDEMPESGEDDPIAMAQHLFVAADRYDLERLRLICEDMLRRHLDTSKIASTLVLAEQHQCHRLKELIFTYLSSPAKLKSLVQSDYYEHLMESYPNAVKELIVKIADLWI